MIGYYGSKSGCYSEALWDHYWLERGMAAQVDSLDGRNPTFEEQNLLPRHATSVRGMSVFVAT